jgi:hypothetical protein
MEQLELRCTVKAFDNAPHMIDWLAEHLKNCSLISLDHDLGPNREANGERQDPGTGRDVADFLVGRVPSCPVIIHTSNSMARVGMELVLREGSWQVLKVFPTPETGWIYSSWLGTARRALGLGDDQDHK